ncbi:MAG TPA: extracellular solute-binding protein [Candidatus Limnocylindria bacterium]|nr:extracellular solute-binding protein [Candidatus Limnocylindria bacterium]
MQSIGHPWLRWAALLSTLALVTAACTATPVTTPAPAPTGQPTAAATSTPVAPATGTPTAPTAAPTASEPTPEAISGTVTYWAAYDQVGPEFRTMSEVVIPAFQAQYPGVTVDLQGIPYDDLRQRLITGIAGGEVPDLLRADIIWVPEFAEQGALLALDQEMEDFDELAGQVFEGPLSTNFWEGQYYGLPLDTNTRVLFANRAVMEEAGLTEMPTTVEEFEAMMAAIAELGPERYGYAEGGTGAWNVLPWIWSFGGALTNDDYTTSSGFVNGEGTVAAVTKLKEWLDAGYLSPSILGGGSPTSEDIGGGRAGTVLEGPWMPPIFEAQFPELETELAPVPAGPGGSASVVGGEDIVVFAQTQNKEAALAFLRFLLSEEVQLEMGKVGQMPVLTSLSGHAELPDYFDTFSQQLETARARTPHPNWPLIDEALGNAVLEALRGDKPVQQALDDAAATIDGLLQP